MTISYNIYSILDLVLKQFVVIFPYWILGLVIGSLISVFCSGKIIIRAAGMESDKFKPGNIIFAVLLGAASPVCMYGTIPLIASLGRKKIPQYVLAAFMVSSILINPNLFIYSFALGAPIALIRLLLCLVAGTIAGLLVYLFFREKTFFKFDGFGDKPRPSKSPTYRILLADMHRAVIKTAPYFFLGILLSALFEWFVPKDDFVSLFVGNKKLGVILATSLGVPVYMCGGGTIPLLRAWLDMGMSMGAAISFMLSGAATKITNLSAVKIILGFRNFIFYILFNILFALLSGWIVDAINYFL